MTSRGVEQPTRERLLDTAERLFAEHGLAAVSHRRIAEESGQANNSAVGYHLGDRRQLVAALVRRHVGPMDERRVALLDAAAGSPDLRDHVACLVRPLTDHLAGLGTPSWYARFVAHATTDPTLRKLVLDEVTATEPMQRALTALLDHAPDTPPAVASLRADMARHLVVHVCAEAERSFADRAPEATADWSAIATSLIDALAGLLAAPVTTAPHDNVTPREESYFTKHGRMAAKEYQHNVPLEWSEPGTGPRRFWGV